MMNKRIENLQKILQREELDGALYATSGNMQYFLDDTDYAWQRTAFTGFVISDGSGDQIAVPDCILYIPCEGEPTLLLTPIRERDMKHIDIKKTVGPLAMFTGMLEATLHGHRFACGSSGYKYMEEYIHEFSPDAEAVNGEEFGRSLRAVKDEKEIAVMRELCRFTDESMEKITHILKPGISNWEVEQYIYELGKEIGCVEQPFGPTVRFYQTGKETDFQVDGYRTSSVLKKGSSISFDYGYTWKGYNTDFGRSFYCGKAPDEIRRAYAVFQEAQLRVIERIQPGDPMTYGFRMIHDYVEKAGYTDCVRHYFDFDLLGHQVGIEVHEGPWLHNRQSEVFKPGMIFTIEPKFWWPGHCFMRIEDMVLMTDRGAECLTNFDRSMFELSAD